MSPFGSPLIRATGGALLLAAALGACQRQTEQAAQPDAMTPPDPMTAASARPGEGSRTDEMGRQPGTSSGPASAPTIPDGASGPQGMP